jgi:hypothetical protein
VVTLADPPPEVDPPGGAAALAWEPGVYSAEIVVREADRPEVVSNAIPFALAPKVTVSSPNAVAGVVDVTVDCLPPPGAGQRATLLLTGQPPIAPEQITPPAAAGQPARILFRPTLASGDYLAILRVDDADSMPYRVHTLPNGASTLEYDPADRITVA